MAKMGRRIAQARHEAGFSTTNEFAAALGISVHTVRGWERDKACPRNPSLHKISELTGKPISWFFGEAQATLAEEAAKIDEMKRRLAELDPRTPKSSVPSRTPASAGDGGDYLMLPCITLSDVGAQLAMGFGSSEEIAVLAQMVPEECADDAFVIKLGGEDELDAGVRVEERLVICPGVDVEDGHVVIAIIDGAAAIRRAYKSGSQYLLVSDNPEHPPRPATRAEIVGRAVAAFRDL